MTKVRKDKRSNADVLAIAGYSNTKTLAQALQVLETINPKNGITTWCWRCSTQAIQPYDIQEVYNTDSKYPDIGYSVSLVKGHSTSIISKYLEFLWQYCIII